MDTVLSIVALGAVALVGGAIYFWRIGRRQQSALMLILAVVLVLNLLIWTVPDSSGTAPIDRPEVSGS
jgi:drug/metabolite transporter superfamily protein YnfA